MNRQRGFTLIEMLIVIAILAILAAGTLAPIVAPAREQRLADYDMENAAATERLVPLLVEDAHSASRFANAGDGHGIALVRASGAAVSVYRIGEDGVLRRALVPIADAAALLDGASMPANAQPMLESASDLAANEPADGTLRVVVRSQRTFAGNPSRARIDLSLNLGHSQHGELR